MPIFKFTNQKPSSLKIWTTLIDTPIHPREGYTEDQIRYRMFICLQLTKDFKAMVTICNTVLGPDNPSLGPLIIHSVQLTSCQESDFSDLEVLSDLLPNWVSSELYVPYYLTKMLCIKKEDPQLLMDLFDRTHLPVDEHLHWSIAIGMYSGLTAYKFYNSMYMDEMLSYVTISYDRTPRYTMSKDEMCSLIKISLLNSIEVSDNYIIPENAKITIPYFILDKGTSDAS